MMQTRAEQLYFRDINKYDLLTNQEEKILINDVQNEVEGAADKLITANLRFVVSVARKYRGRGLSYLELINEGNMGLLKAAQRFDQTKEVKFISYAVWWIRQSIQKAVFEQSGSIRIPMNKITLLNRFKKALDKHDGDFDVTLALDEFKKHKLDIIDVYEKRYEISLDAQIGSDSDDGGARNLLDTLGEDPSQDAEHARRELGGIIDKAMQNITSREERILRMYYGLNFSKNFTLEEIGAELNLTRERVRLIRDRSLRKIHKNPEAREHLTEFLNAKIEKE